MYSMNMILQMFCLRKWFTTRFTLVIFVAFMYYMALKCIFSLFLFLKTFSHISHTKIPVFWHKYYLCFFTWICKLQLIINSWFYFEKIFLTKLNRIASVNWMNIEISQKVYCLFRKTLFTVQFNVIVDSALKKIW